MKVWSTVQLADLLGCKQHYIIHLVERGIIVPLKDAHGRGKSRMFSEENMKQIKAARNLTECGVSHRDVGLIIKHWKDINALVWQTKKYKELFYNIKGV